MSNDSSYSTKIFCPILKEACVYSRRTENHWYCRVGNYEGREEETPCKKGEGRTIGARNFSFTLYEDGSAKISKSWQPKDIIELSRNQLLDIYDDITRLYDSSQPTKIEAKGVG